MKPATQIRCFGAMCLILAACPAIPGHAQGSASLTRAAVQPELSYADLVDLTERAPIIAEAKVTGVTQLPPERAGSVPDGFRRVYVEAAVANLIRGEGGISPIVTYLLDMPVDSRGKIAKLKKLPVLLFARPGGRPGQIQLIARDAQQRLTPVLAARTRSVVGELLSGKAPPTIIGLGDAFHVAGTIAGEGETQIFLKTPSGDPVSLSIIRRPGQAPTWAVALGEIVDEAARPPERDTLLWYRLACGLPPALPPASVRTLAVQDAEAARADYRFVLQSLGPCTRTRAAG
ncbi:hypothetical protein GGR44_003060 [Sphingobium fontiphilum]|uniref:Uncharacterized protein n=1 Tax=Sphingobium fontiphilum TaxID=944425 RepID=A0A7W6GQ96_9SPHN|nr:hypothetical protein [Sphingobium fontiphilum]MBB3983372.1 hypothetical protein [Sphingobium fontiphilum]